MQFSKAFFKIFFTTLQKKAPCRNKGRLTIACHMKRDNYILCAGFYSFKQFFM